MAAKRPRDEPLWELNFPSVAPLLSVASAVQQLNETTSFSVEQGSIRTQVVSSAKSCMVSSQIQCETTIGADDSYTFSVHAKTFVRALKNVGPNQAVNITQMLGSDDIAIRAVDDMSRSRGQQWLLPKVVDDIFTVELDEIDYSGEWVYDTKTLKSDLQ